MILLRPLHHREPYNSQVVACDIFATPNSLKSHVARKLKSPFSNIHAIPFKLCPHSRPTTVQNSLSFGSRVPLKSPYLDARHGTIRPRPRGFVTWRVPDAGRRARGNVRDGRHPKTFT